MTLYFLKMRNGFLYVLSDQADSVLYVGLICYNTEKYCSGVINKSYRMGFLWITWQFGKACVSSLSRFFHHRKKTRRRTQVFLLRFFFFLLIWFEDFIHYKFYWFFFHTYRSRPNSKYKQKQKSFLKFVRKIPSP